MTARLLVLALATASIAACSAGVSSEGLGHSSAEVSAAACGTAPAWGENVSYAVGSLVSYGGAVYQCIQAHTSEPGWTPAAVPALWSTTSCAPSTGGGSSSGGSSGGGAVSGSSGGSSGGTASGSSSGGSSSSGGGASGGCPAWVYMATSTSCDSYVGASCGWTTSDEGQGYHCTNMGSWVGCEPGGGGTCGGGTASGSSSGGTASGSSSGSSGSGGGTGLASILSEAQFDSMFPNRNGLYTYAALVQAAGTYSAFATTGGSDGSKREVAAFLANVAHETGALVYVDEIAQAQYCSPTADCPCAPGAEYFGRGAMQLSWNFNYCAAGAALGAPLQANPSLISTDSRLAWLTGVWFWMTSTGAGSQTPHNAIASTGFGATIQAINGSIECNGGAPAEVQDRVQYYLSFCAMLGVSPGSNTGC